MSLNSAVAVDEAEDALGAAEAIERTVAEQGVDEQCTGGADVGGALATPRGRLHEEVDFLRWQVRDDGPPLTWARAAVRGDQGVLMEELDLAPGGAHPESLADQAKGPGVIGTVEDDVAIAMELRPFPLGQFPGRDGQREQRGALEVVEERERDLLGRPVHATAGDLECELGRIASEGLQYALAAERFVGSGLRSNSRHVAGTLWTLSAVVSTPPVVSR